MPFSRGYPGYRHCYPGKKIDFEDVELTLTVDVLLGTTAS